jgi:hypothetical protein
MDREMDRQMEGWIDRSGAGQVDDGRTDRRSERQREKETDIETDR